MKTFIALIFILLFLVYIGEEHIQSKNTYIEDNCTKTNLVTIDRKGNGSIVYDCKGKANGKPH